MPTRFHTTASSVTRSLAQTKHFKSTRTEITNECKLFYQAPTGHGSDWMPSKCLLAWHAWLLAYLLAWLFACLLTCLPACLLTCLLELSLELSLALDPTFPLLGLLSEPKNVYNKCYNWINKLWQWQCVFKAPSRSRPPRILTSTLWVSGTARSPAPSVPSAWPGGPTRGTMSSPNTSPTHSPTLVPSVPRYLEQIKHF